MSVGLGKLTAVVGGSVATVAIAVAAVSQVGSGGNSEGGEAPLVPSESLTQVASGAPGESVVSVPASSEPTETTEPAAPLEEPTLVASFAVDTPRFDEPDGSKVGEVPATWHGRPSILPVIEQRPGWLHVRLAERPNGSTAWVRRDDVELATTPYRVEIDVHTTRLRAYEDGQLILDAPAGLGTEDNPTTVGNFFVAFVQDPPDTTSGWGPFVIVTSSHSETISDFQSFGDAIAAIHGPLGAADKIGDKGAYVSHGCIRLHLDDLDVLSELPVGTPIDVIDSSPPRFVSNRLGPLPV